MLAWPGADITSVRTMLQTEDPALHEALYSSNRTVTTPACVSSLKKCLPGAPGEGGEVVEWIPAHPDFDRDTETGKEILEVQ
jgi:hypothetical protein